MLTHKDAKPTTFKGVRFRSRLEARWAVVFDELFIPWEYEPETLPTADGGGYTPDFVLKSRDGRTTFVEVKPAVPPDAYKRRVFDCIIQSGRFGVDDDDFGTCLLLLGPVPFISGEPTNRDGWMAVTTYAGSPRAYTMSFVNKGLVVNDRWPGVDRPERMCWFNIGGIGETPPEVESAFRSANRTLADFS